MVYGTLKNVDDLFIESLVQDGKKKFKCKKCNKNANGNITARKNHVQECQLIELSVKKEYLKHEYILNKNYDPNSRKKSENKNSKL